MKMKNLTALKWIGGKHGKEDIYISQMLPHRIYVDCTFGSGAVTFAKEDVMPAGYKTVVNDKNDHLINFMLQLRDNSKELIRLCQGLPWSESLFEKYKKEPFPDDPLERAVRFFYVMRLSFSGGGHRYKNGLGRSKLYQNKATTYMHAAQLLNGMAERIKRWEIFCRDMVDLIEFFDHPDTFFFIDPPYVGFEEIYAGGFSPQDHERLRKALDGIKGKAMVCYYDHRLIRELYSDWYITSYKTVSQIQCREEGGTCPVRTELILTNYRPPEHGQVSFFNLNLRRG